MPKEYFVYIMTNFTHTVLYTGVTNNIERRALEHASHNGSKFTKRYQITELVYIETYRDINDAIRREKQIKAGSRQSKIELIVSQNPTWKNLLFER